MRLLCSCLTLRHFITWPPIDHCRKSSNQMALQRKELRPIRTANKAACTIGHPPTCRIFILFNRISSSEYFLLYFTPPCPPLSFPSMFLSLCLRMCLCVYAFLSPLPPFPASPECWSTFEAITRALHSVLNARTEDNWLIRWRSPFNLRHFLHSDTTSPSQDNGGAHTRAHTYNMHTYIKEYKYWKIHTNDKKTQNEVLTFGSVYI